MSAADPLESLGISLDVVLRELPTTVTIVDAAGNILYVNRQARELTEDRLGRAVPETLLDATGVFHLDGRPYEREEWPVVRSIRSGEVIVNEDYFHLLPDGSRLFSRASSVPVYDRRGRIVAGALVTVDVTAEKNAEEQLAHHRSLLDNVDDAVVTLDAHWNVTGWNGGAERMYGWSADEILGRHTTEVAHLELSDHERARIRDAVASEGRWRGEVIAYCKDGTTVTVELSTVAVHDSEGRLTGFVGIHRDVTARREADLALRRSHERIETILESIYDPFVAVDREWRYTYVNDRALERMRARNGSSLTLEDTIGRSMWELFPGVVETEIRRRYDQAMRERSVVEFESYLVSTGEWIEARAVPMDGGLAIYYRDVTERKLAQDERERASHRQALVAEFGLRALASRELQVLMDDAVGIVAETIGLELAAVAEVTPGGTELLLRAGIGWQTGMVGRASGGFGRASFVGYTLRFGEPVVSEDLAAEERFDSSPLLSDHLARSGIAVLIAGRDEPFGVLAAFSTRPRTFNSEDVSFVQAIANVLAAGVEAAQTAQRIIEVKETERMRIARDLHDEALSELMQALAEAAAPRGLPAKRLVPALKRVGEHLRGAIYDLRLASEEQMPFSALLGALVEVHRARSPELEIELVVEGEVLELPAGVAGTEVLRILGEALTNARRHSGASSLTVGVRRADGRLLATVEDNGHGFDPVTPASFAAAGITGMRERAALLNGRLDIESGPSGSCVRLELNLDGEPDLPAEPIRVLLVEDHAAVREAIAAAFANEAGLTIVGQAGSLAEARQLLDGVDVAVIDLGLPDGNGADLIPELRRVNRHAHALVLSSTLDRSQLARAIEHGASGALNKLAHLDEVVDSVRRLRAGETLLPVEEVLELARLAAHDRAREYEDRQSVARLTRREREVLQALAEGLDGPAMAEKFHITIRTQRNHIANILSKLGVHSQLQALLLALRYEIVEITRTDPD